MQKTECEKCGAYIPILEDLAARIFDAMTEIEWDEYKRRSYQHIRN